MSTTEMKESYVSSFHHCLHWVNRLIFSHLQSVAQIIAVETVYICECACLGHKQCCLQAQIAICGVISREVHSTHFLSCSTENRTHVLS